jgi:hypothetical protein
LKNTSRPPKGGFAFRKDYMATRTKYLVSDILQIISDLRGESTVNTGASRIRAVSRADQDFANRGFWGFYLLSDQFQAGDGTSNYTIGSATYPMRLKGLCDVRVGGTDESYRYTIVDINTYRINVTNNSSKQVCYEWFDAANDVWKVHVNATPAATDTIYYSHYWTPPVHTATTDSVVCPNPRIIALLALSEIYAGEDESNKAIESKNEAEQLINEVTGIDNAPAVNQITTFSSVNTKGIGSY